MQTQGFKISPTAFAVIAACALATGGALVFSNASRAADEPKAGQPRPALPRAPPNPHPPPPPRGARGGAAPAPPYREHGPTPAHLGAAAPGGQWQRCRLAGGQHWRRKKRPAPERRASERRRR